MSAPQNPDTRPMPPGWISQYDINYKTWFYVNTTAQPPVTTWEHPLGPPSRSPPPPASYGPPTGPPPGNAPRSGYGQGSSYGNYGGPPGPYGGPSGGYGGPPPPGGYNGPPGGYNGPPGGYNDPPRGYGGPPGGYGGPPGGGYPQYGEGYAQDNYDQQPADRGRGFGGLFGRQSPNPAAPKQGGGFGKLALLAGGGALAAFAAKEFVDHEEHKAFDEGRREGYDQGFDTGFVDGGDGIW